MPHEWRNYTKLAAPILFAACGAVIHAMRQLGVSVFWFAGSQS